MFRREVRDLGGVWGRAQVIMRSPAAQNYWETDEEDRGMGYGNFAAVRDVKAGDFVFSQSGRFVKVLKVLKAKVDVERWYALYVDDPLPVGEMMTDEAVESIKRYGRHKGFFLGYVTDNLFALGGVMATLLRETRQIPHPVLRMIERNRIYNHFVGSPYCGATSKIPKDAYHCVDSGIVFTYYNSDIVKMWAKNGLVRGVNEKTSTVTDEVKNHAPNFLQMVTFKAVRLDYNIMGDNTAYSLVTEDGTFLANGLYLRSAEDE